MADHPKQVADEITVLVGQGDSLADVTAEGRAVTAEALEYAKSIAPYDENRPKSRQDRPHFRDTLQYRRLDDVDGLPAWRIYSTDDPAKVGSLEYGTPDTPEFATFAKTGAHIEAEQQ